MRFGLLAPTGFYVGAGLLAFAAPCLFAQPGSQQAFSPPVRINTPAPRHDSTIYQKQFGQTRKQSARPQKKPVGKTRLAQQYLMLPQTVPARANRLVWKPLPRATQPQRLALAQVNWQVQQAKQQLAAQPQPYVLHSQPLPLTQTTNRNLLFTPEDAAQTKLVHPLLTPDIQATVVPLNVSAESHPVAPRK